MKKPLCLLLLLSTTAAAHHDGHHVWQAPAAAAGKAVSSAPPMAPSSVQPPAASAPAQPPAASWTRQPLLMPQPGARGERSAARLRLVGISAPTVSVFAPEGPSERLKVDYPVAPDGVKIESATPKIGNYHWVVVREETPEQVKVASTAWYFSNPGASPKMLLQQPKHELEIVPDPLPREHAGYREAQKWHFQVRFNGHPLPHQPVTLETEFGSRSTVHTDAAGLATVLFPRDFKPAPKDGGEHAGHGPRRAAFVLSTTIDAAGRSYLTAFNHFYSMDAERNHDLGWGAAFGLAGMLAALPLLRRRQGSMGDANHA